MTKYDELLGAVENYHRELSAYRDECQEFAEHLVDSFLAYLGDSGANLLVMPSPGHPNFPEPEFQPYAFPGVMHIGDDGNWQFTICLSMVKLLPTRRHVFPDLLMIRVMLKKEQCFIITAEHLDKSFDIGPDGDDRLKGFFDAIVESIKTEYKEMLREKIRGKRPFGFVYFRKDDEQ